MLWWVSLSSCDDNGQGVVKYIILEAFLQKLQDSFSLLP